jgi:hypothetical protein
MSRYPVLVLVLASSLLLPACGKKDTGSTPVTPTPTPVFAQVAGTWSGTASSSTAPEFGLTIGLTLAQSGSAVTGNFSCQGFFCIANAGTVTATVSTSTFTAQVAFPNGGGSCGTFNGTVTDNNTKMTGTYACTAPGGVSDTGTWTATKTSATTSTQ